MPKEWVKARASGVRSGAARGAEGAVSGRVGAGVTRTSRVPMVTPEGGALDGGDAAWTAGAKNVEGDGKAAGSAGDENAAGAVGSRASEGAVIQASAISSGDASDGADSRRAGGRSGFDRTSTSAATSLDGSATDRRPSTAVGRPTGGGLT